MPYLMEVMSVQEKYALKGVGECIGSRFGLSNLLLWSDRIIAC